MEGFWLRNVLNAMWLIVGLLFGVSIGYRAFHREPTTDRLEAVSVDEFTPPTIVFPE